MTVKFDMYAKNNSGVQKMWIAKEGDEYYFTLTGDYNGEDIQIDFDTTSEADLLRMKQAIELVLAIK